MLYQEWKYIRDNDSIAIQCNQTQVGILLKHIQGNQFSHNFR